MFRTFITTRVEEENGEEEGVVPVCTDLAARGLDESGVTTVVQLQFAGDVIAHLHRVGRYGRVGNWDERGVVFYWERERGSWLRW